MIHRGEIVEQAVRSSGHNLSSLAKRFGKSRKWLYDAFDNPTLSIDYIFEIGKVIHYDFSNDLPEFRKTYTSDAMDNLVEEPSWKTKYITLLEEHQRLLARLLALQEEK
ncbi:MAG: hypothetical protein RL365_873 [Bacteroidota bacterium]|jgi:hypothetical protein